MTTNTQNPTNQTNAAQVNSPSVNTPGSPPLVSNSTNATSSGLDPAQNNNSTNDNSAAPLANATYSSGPNLWGKIKSFVNLLSVNMAA